MTRNVVLAVYPHKEKVAINTTPAQLKEQGTLIEWMGGSDSK
jgi:hypothetical protein